MAADEPGVGASAAGCQGGGGATPAAGGGGEETQVAVEGQLQFGLLCSGRVEDSQHVAHLLPRSWQVINRYLLLRRSRRSITACA